MRWIRSLFRRRRHYAQGGIVRPEPGAALIGEGRFEIPFGWRLPDERVVPAVVWK
jgi:hypothetical protein